MDHPLVIVVLLGAVIFVFAWIQVRGGKHPTERPDILEEMSETFDHFAKEMEADNERLLRHVSDVKQQHVRSNQAMLTRIGRLEEQLQDVQQQMVAAKQKQQEATTSNHNRRALDWQQEEEKRENRIKERYRELYELHSQGKSIDYIAKKLQMNQGEVQLILTLVEQEEALYVEK